MKENDIDKTAMLHDILRSLDMPITVFDADRKIIYSNHESNEISQSSLLGVCKDTPHPTATNEAAHFEENEYYDISGNLLVYPTDSPLQHAVDGKATHELLLEHRNKKDFGQRFILVSCVPIKDTEGKFLYGILWYTDISACIAHENKLKFLVAALRVLSLDPNLENRLEQNAKLLVPVLADWISVDFVTDELTALGTFKTKQVTLFNRNIEMIDLFNKYEKKYAPYDSPDSAMQQVIKSQTPFFVKIMLEQINKGFPDMSDERRADTLTLGITSYMMVPIILGGKTISVLTLAYAESGRVYSEADVSFIEEFAHYLSILSENSKLYDEISRHDHAKDIFLAQLSHELRNPLAPIKNAIELLILKNKDPSLEGEIGVVSHQFDHLTKLLGDLLDTTRFTSGKIVLDMKPTDLTNVILNVVTAITPIVEKSALKFKVEYPKETLWLSIDATRIEQALLNLLYNAIKFTPRGGLIWLKVTKGEKMVTIHVKDTGVGITTPEMEYIFEPYYQGERTRDKNSGLGIGLVLVRQVIQLHGGKVEVQSEGVEKGSEFVISLPLILGEHTIKSKNENGRDAKISNTAKKKILIVDDNQAAADSLVRLFEALGHTAHSLYAGKDVLSFLAQHDVDVIFLDVGMPEMNGYELVKLLRENRHSKEKIVALTGYGLEEDKQKAMNAGFDFHLTKPVGIRELKEVL